MARTKQKTIAVSENTHQLLTKLTTMLSYHQEQQLSQDQVMNQLMGTMAFLIERTDKIFNDPNEDTAELFRVYAGQVIGHVRTRFPKA